MRHCIQNLAASFVKYFDREFREENGSTVVVLTASAPQALQYLAHEVQLPHQADHFRMAYLLASFQALIEANSIDAALAKLGTEASIHQLTTWLHSNNRRIHYIDAVQEAYGPIDQGTQLLAMAQLMEKHEVFAKVFHWLEDILESQIGENEG